MFVVLFDSHLALFVQHLFVYMFYLVGPQCKRIDYFCLLGHMLHNVWLCFIYLALCGDRVELLCTCNYIYPVTMLLVSSLEFDNS